MKNFFGFVLLIVLACSGCARTDIRASSTPSPTAPIESKGISAPCPSATEPILEEIPQESVSPTIEPVTAWGSYSKSYLTNGEITIVPEMRFDRLPTQYRETLIFVDDTAKLPEGEPNRDIITIKRYENKSLIVETIGFNEDLVDKTQERYADAGVEYIFTVTALDDSFYNFRGIRLGSSAVAFELGENDLFHYSGCPYLDITTKDGVVTELHARTFAEVETLKDKTATDEKCSITA